MKFTELSNSSIPRFVMTIIIVPRIVVLEMRNLNGIILSAMRFSTLKKRVWPLNILAGEASGYFNNSLKLRGRTNKDRS